MLLFIDSADFFFRWDVGDNVLVSTACAAAIEAATVLCPARRNESGTILDGAKLW